MHGLFQRSMMLICALGLVSQLSARGDNLIDVNINNEDLELEYTSINEWSRNSQTFMPS